MQIDAMPAREPPITWVMHIEAHAPPIMIPEKKREENSPAKDASEREKRLKRITNMIKKDFCHAKSEVHRTHADSLLSHIAQAEKIAKNIPTHGTEKNKRVVAALEVGLKFAQARDEAIHLAQEASAQAGERF